MVLPDLCRPRWRRPAADRVTQCEVCGCGLHARRRRTRMRVQREDGRSEAAALAERCRLRVWPSGVHPRGAIARLRLPGCGFPTGIAQLPRPPVASWVSRCESPMTDASSLIAGRQPLAASC